VSGDTFAAEELAGDIQVEELHRRRQSGEELALLDVRETHERRICSLGGTLLPLGQLPSRVGELDPNREWIVYCHVGVRSARAVAFLQDAGFARARNLTGGIQAWAERIDTAMARY